MDAEGLGVRGGADDVVHRDEGPHGDDGVRGGVALHQPLVAEGDCAGRGVDVARRRDLLHAELCERVKNRLVLCVADGLHRRLPRGHCRAAACREAHHRHSDAHRGERRVLRPVQQREQRRTVFTAENVRPCVAAPVLEHKRRRRVGNGAQALHHVVVVRGHRRPADAVHLAQPPPAHVQLHTLRLPVALQLLHGKAPVRWRLGVLPVLQLRQV